MPTTKQENYEEMNAQELAAATAEFDEEFVIDKTKPLSTKGKARHTRARRKAGRPKIGRGAKRVNITVERQLLKQVDAIAKRLNCNRSQLISHALNAMVARRNAH